MRGADAGFAASALSDTLAWASPVVHISHYGLKTSPRCDHACGDVHAAIEVHAVDTNRWVVLDAQIDVLRDTKTEVARLAEVALPQLVFLDFEATLEDFLCFWAADGDVDGDLFVTADTEGTDCESCFAWRAVVLASRSLTISDFLPHVSRIAR